MIPNADGNGLAQERRARTAVWALVALYAAAYTALSITKFRDYLYDDFDLAIFVQALHGIAHGTLFSSIRGMPWPGDHASLVLFAIDPLYALWPSPIALLVLQSVALALGALPVYRMARDRLGAPGLGVAFAALYLLQPALGYANLYEFHPETLSVPLLLCALEALVAGRLARTALWTGLALTGREDVALAVLALAAIVPALRTTRRGAFAATLAGLALASLALTFGVLKPRFDPGTANFGLLYSQWGATPGAAFHTALAHPLALLRALVATPGDPLDSALKRAWFGRLLGPFALLPLLDPVALVVAAPLALEHLLADGHEQHAITYHYAVLLVPVLTWAAIGGAGRLAGRVRAAAVGLALLAATACAVAFGPLVPRAHPLDGVGQAIWPSAEDKALRPACDAFVRRVPPTGAVVASFAFQARLAARDSLHSLHHVLCGHYSISTRPYPTPLGVGALIADLDPAATLASVDAGTGSRMRELIAANGLVCVAREGNLALWLRDGTPVETYVPAAPPPAVPLPGAVFDGAIALMGWDPPRIPVRAGGTVPVRVTWRRVGAAARVFVIDDVLLDAHDRVAFQALSYLGTVVNPVALWPDSTRVRTSDALLLPATLAPGRYTLAVRLATWDGRTMALAPPEPARVADARLLCRLGEVDVAPGRARVQYAP